MKKFCLTFEDVINSNIISQTSFFSPSSYTYIKNIKRNKKDLVVDLLNNHRRLIFEYDNLWQNAYHITAKRGYTHLLYELLHYKGDIDAYDMTGRTPLIWALQDGNVDCIRLLLASGANPFITQTEFLSKVQIPGEVEVMLETAKKLHVVR